MRNDGHAFRGLCTRKGVRKQVPLPVTARSAAL